MAATAWPALHPRSYARWRTLALAALRLVLFALPFNFDAATFDAIVPGPAAGRWAWAANTSHLLMGAHVGGGEWWGGALPWRRPVGASLQPSARACTRARPVTEGRQRPDGPSLQPRRHAGYWASVAGRAPGKGAW